MTVRLSKPSDLSSNFCGASALNRYNIPALYNWREDTQPVILPTVLEHIELSEYLTPHSHHHVAVLLIRAGYVAESQKDSFIQQLTDLPKKKWNDIADLAVDKKFIKPSRHAEMLARLQDLPLSTEAKTIAVIMRHQGFISTSQESKLERAINGLPQNPILQLDGVGISYRIKSAGSATKKLLEPSINQNPANIGDYKGYQITTSSLRDTTKMINTVLDDPAMSSRKCKFMEPSDEGDRRHLSHHIVGESELPFRSEGLPPHIVPESELAEKIEIQIVPAEINEVSKITHKLKDAERSLAAAALALASQFGGNSSYASRMSRCEQEIRSVRTAMNDTVCDRAGYNLLASQDHERYAPSENMMANLESRTRKLLKLAEENSGGVSIKDFIASAGTRHGADLHLVRN